MDIATKSDSTALLFAPVSPGDRISSLDVLRGVAVLGILLMNIVAFGLPLGAYGDPSVIGGCEGANLAAWVVTNMFFEGTFRTIFSMLFGAGVVLFMMRAEQRCNSVKAADLYFRRSLWLIVFGVVHAYLLLWIGEILYAYGVTALVVFAFRNVRPSRLLIVGLLVLAVLVPKRVFHAHEVTEAYEKYSEVVAAGKTGEELSSTQLDTIIAWRKIEVIYKPTPEDLKQEVEMHQSDYLTNVAGLAPINVIVQGEWFYCWNFWDILGAMLIGMALFKSGVLSAQRSTAFYAGMMMLGYGIGLTINTWETKVIVDSQFDLSVVNRMTYSYDVGRLAVTAGHIGVVMLICRQQLFGWIRLSLAAVGRMALTNYVMHSVICLTVFSGFAGGLYGQLQRYQLYYVVGAIWMAQMIVSPIWMRLFQFGPLEWLWRCLTYGHIQPILHTPNLGAAAVSTDISESGSSLDGS